MARYNLELDELGRNIQDIVDRAVSSHDYQKLNQTIRQVVDRAVDIGGEAVRRAADGAQQAGGRVVEESAPVKRYTATPAVQKKKLPELYAPTGGKLAIGILKIISGSMVSAVSLMLLLTNAVIDLLITGAGSVAFPAVMAAVLAAGAGLTANGIGNVNRIERFKKYRKALGDKTHCTLEKLSRAVGKSEKFVRKEIQKMIDQRLFLEGHLDYEETSLITSDETYKLFEQSRLQLEQRQQEQKRLQAEAETRKASLAHPPQVQEVLDKGNAFIAQIRSCNDAIPGEEISAKISRMELIVQRIFQRAEAHPEIIPDLKKMMDYYLPMTVKLLNAYAEMDAQPVQGETIRASKREIEETLDTLNLAFEKLLDSVFEDTALDVSSDISVLQTLLAQEGLTEDALTQLKNQPRL